MTAFPDDRCRSTGSTFRHLRHAAGSQKTLERRLTPPATLQCLTGTPGRALREWRGAGPTALPCHSRSPEGDHFPRTRMTRFCVSPSTIRAGSAWLPRLAAYPMRNAASMAPAGRSGEKQGSKNLRSGRRSQTGV